MRTADVSPVTGIYEALREHHASWNADVVTPAGPDWIAGTDLRNAVTGPFNALLRRIGERAKTGDRRTIAASFALRYGWTSAMAIAPYLRFGCVPDIALDNVSFKFRESTFLERTAMHQPRGTVAVGDPRAAHPAISTVPDADALLRALRAALVAQSAPVVEALYGWSRFARKGTWGMLTSSWAAHFTGLSGGTHDQRHVLPLLAAFFAGDDFVARMQPRVRPVTYLHVTHLYQRRASCCRYYLLPQGDLCASCPLVPDDERLARNRAWMKTQLERQGERQKKEGHG